MKCEILKKRWFSLPKKRSEIFVHCQYKKIWPVALMCQILGVKRNNYYIYHERKANVINNITHQVMIELIKKSQSLVIVHTRLDALKITQDLEIFGYPKQNIYIYEGSKCFGSL